MIFLWPAPARPISSALPRADLARSQPRPRPATAAGPPPSARTGRESPA